MQEDFVPFHETIQTIQSGSVSSSRQNGPALINDCSAPWLSSDVESELKSLPPFVRLHNEIIDFCRYIEPKDKEKRLRKKVIDDITAVVSSLFDSAEVRVFGSELTQLLTPTSDIDLVE